MGKLKSNPFWIDILLLIPLLSGIIAVLNHDFLFKAGVAASGILILAFLNYFRLINPKGILLIILAFLFSIGGDWFLSNRHGRLMMFIAGIGLYFFAHLFYLVYALANGKINWRFTGILLAGFLLFFIVVLYPGIPDKVLMVAALVYLLISCFSLGAAFGIKTEPLTKWAYFFGILLILFSDTIISLKEFVRYKELNFLILPTYYLAQISIVFSLISRRK
jgi:uncharacterized membrane protein YhhN